MRQQRLAQHLTRAKDAISEAENVLHQAERSSPKEIKTNSAGWEQQTVYLPADLRQWLKVYAATTGRELSDIAAEALQEFRLKQRGGRG